MTTKKKNDNCLWGMRCPKCKSLEPFYIDAEVTVLVGDDGTEDRNSDYMWEDKAYCECHACTYAATVKDFIIPKKKRKKAK